MKKLLSKKERERYKHIIAAWAKDIKDSGCFERVIYRDMPGEGVTHD